MHTKISHQYANVQSIGLSQIASHTNFNLFHLCQAHNFSMEIVSLSYNVDVKCVRYTSRKYKIHAYRWYGAIKMKPHYGKVFGCKLNPKIVLLAYYVLHSYAPVQSDSIFQCTSLHIFFSFFYVNRLCQAQNVKLPLYAISSTTNQTKPRRFLNEFMMHVNHHEQQLDPVYIYISAPIVAANLYWTKTKMKEKLSQNRKSHKIEKIFLDSAISRECFGFKMEHILLQSKHANK